MTAGATIVLDFGKSLAKASLWDESGRLIAKRSRPNEHITDTQYRTLDAAGTEAWLSGTLEELGRLAAVDKIIPVSHGAAAALVRGGRLLLPPLDYEHPIPTATRHSYDGKRDCFVNTGSPALPDGLNLGAQLYYLQTLRPEAFKTGTQIMPWAQYWSWLLSGVGCSEVTSLGCHTDLWCPSQSSYSRLAVSQGWSELMAPLRRAGEPLGTLLPQWQKRTGLPATTVIHCGLHDSNAALLAARGFDEISNNEATVLSTGTWFVSMRTPTTPFDQATLPEGRDCLVNVDAFNQMIPSARFMGGREIELLTGVDGRRIDMKPDQAALLAAIPEVVSNDLMILPTLAAGTGPFPNSPGQWLSTINGGVHRRAAACLYAALLADTSLDLIGSQGRVLVEGRFAESEAFVRTLASLRPNTIVYRANAHSDVSYGALRLLNPELPPPGRLESVEPIPVSLGEYRARWRSEAERSEAAAA